MDKLGCPVFGAACSPQAFLFLDLLILAPVFHNGCFRGMQDAAHMLICGLNNPRANQKLCVVAQSPSPLGFNGRRQVSHLAILLSKPQSLGAFSTLVLTPEKTQGINSTTTAQGTQARTG